MVIIMAKCLTNGCDEQTDLVLVRFCAKCRMEYGKYKRKILSENFSQKKEQRDLSDIDERLTEGFRTLHGDDDDDNR